MNSNRVLLIFFALIIIVQACQVDSIKITQPPFFDLDDFFKKELTNLSSLQRINKKVSLNGKVEEKTLTEFDLKKDLEVFTNSNINKVAWLDKYQVDSLSNANGVLEKIVYKALDEKLKTRELIVNFEKNNITSISITNASSNQVAAFEQKLIYSPKKGYSIQSNQEVSLSDPQELLVLVEFLSN